MTINRNLSNLTPNISETGTVNNSGLTNNKVTVGTTEISLGSTSTTLDGLTSVTSTTFVGNLTGNATNITGNLDAAKITTGTIDTARLPALFSGSYTDLTNKPTLGTAAAATAPTGDIVGTTDAQTLTNKRITSRVSLNTALASNYTLNSDSFDTIIATQQNTGVSISLDSGSPSDGQKLLFRFKDNGTQQAITFPTTGSKAFRAVGVTLPANTGGSSKTVYIGCVYNFTDSLWDIVAYSTT